MFEEEKTEQSMPAKYSTNVTDRSTLDDLDDNYLIESIRDILSDANKGNSNEARDEETVKQYIYSILDIQYDRATQERVDNLIVEISKIDGEFKEKGSKQQ